MPTRKLQIDRVEKPAEPKRMILHLEGVIDEDADLCSAFTGLKPETVLDLEGVRMINSAGVREWVNAIAKVSPQTRLLLAKCSPRIVEQLNYVSSFIGRGHVISFYAPYFCPKCKAEQIVLLQSDEVRKKGLREPPNQKCPTCKGAMEFDDIAEEYFSFL